MPSPTLQCSSYRKGSLRVALDYGYQLTFGGSFQGHQVQTESSSLSCSTFSFDSFYFHSVVHQNYRVYLMTFIFAYKLTPSLVFTPRFVDPFVSQNLRRFSAPHFPGRIVICAYTIWSYGQISIFTTYLCLVLHSFCASLLHSLLMFHLITNTFYIVMYY